MFFPLLKLHVFIETRCSFLASLTVSCVVTVIFRFSRISLFAFAYVFTLHCNACAWHAVNKGNLLTYFRIDSGPRSDTASVRRRNVPLKFSH